MYLRKILLLTMAFMMFACSSEHLGQTLPTVEVKTATAIYAGVNEPTLTTMPNPPAVTASLAPPLSRDFWMDLPVVPSTISDRAREIYRRGILMGNNPNAFSKVGDCHSTVPYFLADYDGGTVAYQLGEYAYLQPTIDYFRGSFGRVSLSAKQGLSTAGVLAPLWADWKQCNSNETPLDCELRHNHPSIAIISLGTNEAYDVKKDKSTFEGRLRRIIEHAIDQGVVPILSTKADNDEGDHYINYVTAKLALEYQLPLWNFWKAMQPLPQHGMRSADHLTFARTLSYADFSKPEYLKNGMQMRNLTALEVLDLMRRELASPETTSSATPMIDLSTTSDAVHTLGESMISPIDGTRLIYIPAGQFEMGSSEGGPDEAPAHAVSLNAYWMDSTEVTNVIFAAFLNANGNQMEGGTNWLNANIPFVQIFKKDGFWQVRPGKENYPIAGVSWYGANAYCSWAGRRLPTEAEWEYAARGADSRLYPWGSPSELGCDRARFQGCGNETVAVGSLPLGASPFGILDMAGNVAEWVSDRYAEEYYQNSPSENPAGPINGYYRVFRGGSRGSTYIALQTTHRNWAGADERVAEIGFRCALTP